MAEALNILLLGGAKRVSMAEKLMEAGQSRGLDTHLFSYELDPYLPIASVAKIIIGLKWSDPGILADLKKYLTLHGIHMVLPFVDPSVRIASQLVAEAPGVFIPVSEPDACTLMFDKIAADKWFISQEIPVPPKDGGFPRIVKPRFGSASKGIIILQNARQLSEFRRTNRPSEFLVQLHIQAEEYSVDGYLDPQGRIISLVPRKRLEVQGGEATKSITVREPTVIQLAEKVMKTGIFRGPLTLQFLKERDSGQVYMMEVNPRLGGGVLTSIAAGANVAEYLMNDFLHIRNERQDHWKEHVIMTRAFREFYFYADNH